MEGYGEENVWGEEGKNCECLQLSHEREFWALRRLGRQGWLAFCTRVIVIGQEETVILEGNRILWSRERYWS